MERATHSVGVLYHLVILSNTVWSFYFQFKLFFTVYTKIQPQCQSLRTGSQLTFQQTEDRSPSFSRNAGGS